MNTNAPRSSIRKSTATQEKSVLAALLNRLKAAMQAALAESSDVLHVVEEIETHGFKVMLVVDAIISPWSRPFWSTTPSNPFSEPQLELSANDSTRLKSLRIVLNSGKPVEHLDEFAFFLRRRARLGRPVTPEMMDDWFCSEEQEKFFAPYEEQMEEFLLLQLLETRG